MLFKKGVFKIKLYIYNADFGKTKGKSKYKLIFRQWISGFLIVSTPPVQHWFPGYAICVIRKAACVVLRFFGRRFEMILSLRAVDILVFRVKSQWMHSFLRSKSPRYWRKRNFDISKTAVEIVFNTTVLLELKYLTYYKVRHVKIS